MTELSTTQALKLLLRSETGTHVWDYGIQFNDLWSMKSATQGHAIVVWADTPADPDAHPVNTEPHVTPFDWAIAARSRHPKLKVTVIDLRPTQHEQANYSALRWLQTQRPECVPWLRRIDLRLLLAEEQKDFDSLLVLLTKWPDAGALVAEAADALEVLWRAVRTAKDDKKQKDEHHAIANLVGPLLLLRNPPATGHREALRQLLVAAGRAPEVPATSEGDLSLSLLTDIQAMAPLRLVLLDDQWHHGWAEWVSELLCLTWDETAAKPLRTAPSTQPVQVAATGDLRVTLWVAHEPKWLMERVKEGHKKSLPGATDARFRLRLTRGDGEFSEILLLDLRLFLRGEAAAKEFARGLVAEAHRFVSGGAWPTFTKDELARVDSWVNGGPQVDRATILTLLPRLLAQTDLSLPIVLFSSTGLRDVVERLKGYESVITEFSKPRLLGEAAAVAENIRTAFALALREALSLLRGRRCVAACLPQPTADAETKDQDPPTRYTHASLYLDESAPQDESSLTVGGLLALYCNAKHESALDKALKKMGVHWGRGGKPKYKDAKDDNPSWCADIPAAASGFPVKLLPVALTVQNAEQDSAIFSRIGNDWTPKHLDRLHRTLIGAAIEVALFHLVDNMADSWTFGVCADVRSRPTRAMAPERLNEIREKFGIYPEVFSPSSRKWAAIRDIVDIFARGRNEQQDVLLQRAVWSVLGIALIRDLPREDKLKEALKCLVGGDPKVVTSNAQKVKDTLNAVLVSCETDSSAAKRVTAVRDLVEVCIDAKDLLLQRAVWSILSIAVLEDLPANDEVKQALGQLVGGEPFVDADGRQIDSAARAKKALNDLLRHHQSISFMGADAVLPVAEDILHQYEGAERLDALRVIEARGCHLPEDTDGALHPDNRSLHYFSDWVAGAVRKNSHKGTVLPQWLETLLKAGGCNEAYNDDLRRRILHARWAFRGEVVRAGAGLISAGAPDPSASWLRKRCACVVAEAVAASPGSVFVDACRQAEGGTAAGGQSVEGRGLTDGKAVAVGLAGSRRAGGGAVDIRVSNLSSDLEDSDLKQLFEPYGQVRRAKIIRDWETGRSRRFGFVTVASREVAERAIMEMNGQQVKGRSLKVEYSMPARDRS